MENLFDIVETEHCELLDDYASSIARDDVRCEDGVQHNAVYNED